MNGNDNRIKQLENMNKFQSKDIKKAVNYTFELNKEIEFKDKIINLISDNIMTHYQLKTIRKMCCPTCRICTYSGIHRNCIKQYFGSKAKEE